MASVVTPIAPAFSAQAHAQAEAPGRPAGQAASLTGRVTDPTGAVVPGALVTVESANGSRHTVTTDPAGVYSLPVLEPGRYTLTVSLPAFRESRTTVDVTARQQAVRSVSLEILPIEGSVTVEADAVDAIRATVADHYNRNKTITSMEGKTVVDYSPVANYDALRLLPGVMSAGQKDRFSVPSHLRGAGAWGQVYTVFLRAEGSAGDSEAPRTMTRVQFDRYTGALLKVTRPDAPRAAGDHVIEWLGPVHTGNFGGPVIKSLYVVAGLTPALLFVTGFVIWWQRVVARQYRALRGRALTAPAPEREHARPANT